MIQVPGVRMPFPFCFCFPFVIASLAGLRRCEAADGETAKQPQVLILTRRAHGLNAFDADNSGERGNKHSPYHAVL